MNIIFVMLALSAKIFYYLQLLIRLMTAAPPMTSVGTPTLINPATDRQTPAIFKVPLPNHSATASSMRTVQALRPREN